MKVIALFTVVMLSHLANAEVSPKVNLDQVCRQSAAAEKNLDGGNFVVQCRSLDDANSYAGVFKGGGSTMTRMSPPALLAIKIRGSKCIFASFKGTRENSDQSYTATQTSEDGKLTGVYKLNVNGKKSVFTVKFSDGTSDRERFECYNN